MLGVSPGVVKKWCDSGQLDSYRVPSPTGRGGGKDRRILRSSLYSFARANGVPLSVASRRSVLLVALPASDAAAIREMFPDVEMAVAMSSFEAGVRLGVDRPCCIVVDSRSLGRIEASIIQSYVKSNYSSVSVVTLPDDLLSVSHAIGVRLAASEATRKEASHAGA